MVKMRNRQRAFHSPSPSREGVVAARGRVNSSAQLSSPSGIFVDQMGSVYVVDQLNDRGLRWGTSSRNTKQSAE